MDKRNVTKNDFKFLDKELTFYKDNNLISEEQHNNILNQYSIKPGLNFVTILLLVGSLLLGLGILSFIASNWRVIGKPYKFSIIMIIFFICNLAYYKLYETYPKTSISSIYIALITFGSGIFLIGQMFNYGGNFSTAFLLWSIGIFPYTLFLKDKILFIICDIFLIIYIVDHFSLGTFPIAILIAIPLIYYCNIRLFFNPIITFFNNLVVLYTIAFTLERYISNYTISIFTFFIIGIIMYYAYLGYHKYIFNLQGNIIYGVAGLTLTFPDNWQDIKFFTDQNSKIISIIFSICFLIFLLLQTHKKNIISLIFIFFIIMRFYFDTLYDFIPKSLFFIIGGLILLGFGYYFERFRRKGGENYEN
jgi:Predicted membrane protein (DUF2157).